MKKILPALLFLSAKVEMVSAATGERSDDYLVVLVPLVLLMIVWAGFMVKAKITAMKKRKEEAEISGTNSPLQDKADE